jgi:REP element-mobilizing transposase RayT
MSDEKFQNKYRIKSARAAWHDYNGGKYFVTICTKNREHFFGEIVPTVETLHATSPVEMGCIAEETLLATSLRMTEIGKYAFENLQNINIHYPYAEIPLFVVMPNHIHAIVFIDGAHHCRDVARNVSTRNVSTTTEIRNEKMIEIAKHQSLLCVTMRGFKSAITKFAHDNHIDFAWQTRFHDIIIRNQHEMNYIANYIENNPATWETDCFNENNESNKNGL